MRQTTRCSNGARRFYKPSSTSATGHDVDNFQTIAGAQVALSELRRRNGLAVVFHDHTARQKILLEEKLFNRTRKLNTHSLAIGDDSSRWHQVSVRQLPSGGQLMRTP